MVAVVGYCLSQRADKPDTPGHQKRETRPVHPARQRICHPQWNGPSSLSLTSTRPEAAKPEMECNGSKRIILLQMQDGTKASCVFIKIECNGYFQSKKIQHRKFSNVIFVENSNGMIYNGRGKELLSKLYRF